MTVNLNALRAPFPPSDINKLPKPYSKDSEKGNCRECGGYHGLPAAHLDYVGHAAVTNRLLDVDPAWGWEPVAFGPDYLPLLDKNGGLWIRLTIGGVTRLGYGDSMGKTGPNAIKEAIGDALRNGAMRFGVALELWHKGDLSEATEPTDDAIAPEDWRELVDACTTLDQVREMWRNAQDGKWLTAEVREVLTARKDVIAQEVSA